ncbi:DUF6195 family protein [Streptomyces lonarensis]|uniref:Uncharacterized protein n=1 Tax=Streptomyces lonarensis TaxID=700599 RepID=A0A7X6HX78_9ACTN|nr:DUF6195 family protein [Streptomyces lonarensis]NJQ04050.1 hypothetical protein [Streptomyces lonarensis]
MSHPIMSAALRHLAATEARHKTAREAAFRTWGPRSVTAASKYARALLGDAAVTLGWEALSLLSFDEDLQASAQLGTLSGQRFELHYADQGGTERIVLRVSCTSCPRTEAHQVTSLDGLGRLLSRSPAWQDIGSHDGGNL